MYVLAPNNIAQTYPYSDGQLRRDNPQTSFPREMTDERRAAWGMFPVTAVSQPAANDGCKVVEGTPALVNGAWTQTWEQVALTAEEIAARIPRVVTMRQARLALLGAGLLLEVDAAINNLSEPQKSAARIEWEYSGEVHRDKALVLALAPALNLSDADLDALFTTAAAL